MNAPLPCERVAIVGTTGSGKTTLARNLAQRLSLQHIELDRLYWGPDWTPVPLDTFRQQIDQALSVTRWVSDGNYSIVRDIVWGRADTLVWLDYPLPIVFWQLARRTFRRVATREEIWQGNREHLSTQLFTKDSLFRWAYYSHHRHRHTYPEILRQPAYAHLCVIRLRSRAETQLWFSKLPEHSC